jgi:hypothetical protein
MVVRDRSFPIGSPVCDYWLSRCEGFTVRAGGRSLGVVERLAFGMPAGRVEALVLHKRHRRRRALDTGQVLAVVPARQLLLARRSHRTASATHALGRGGSRVSRAAAAATPVVVAVAETLAARAWALAVRAARALRLASARLYRVARRLSQDYKQRLDVDRRRRTSELAQAANEYEFALQQPVGRGLNVGPTRSR